MWNSKSKKKSNVAALESAAEGLFQELLDGAAELQPEDDYDTEQLNMEGTTFRATQTRIIKRLVSQHAFHSLFFIL